MGYSHNKEVVSSRGGHSYYHKCFTVGVFSEFIHTHNISYLGQHILVSSLAVWAVGSLYQKRVESTRGIIGLRIIGHSRISQCCVKNNATRRGLRLFVRL